MSKKINYDYRYFEYLLPKNTLWITGEKDFFTVAQPNVITIKKAAHYPFIENNKQFSKVATKFLEK